MKPKPKIPESFLNEFEGLVARESDSSFEVGYFYLDGWAEFGTAWTKTHFEGNEKECKSWFTESVAAHSGIAPSTLRHHYRVATHVTRDLKDSRGYLYSHWKSMLTGITNPFDEDEFSKRLEWVDNHTDNHGGQPPSPRDIDDHVKGYGDKPKWLKRLKLMINIGKNIRDDHKAPEWLRTSVSALLDMVSDELD